MKRLIVIDCNSVIHRAYHALPPLTTKKGELVNAVYGFLLVFFKALKDFKPDFVVAAFDSFAPTLRHKKYKEYKAKRPKAPEELYCQIPKIKKILSAFNVPVLEKEGFEADDIVGTVSSLAPKKQVLPEIETIILSGDLDVLQLVGRQTKAFILRKGVKDAVLFNENLVKEKYRGLKPGQLVDFKALRGDPSDNIPGVTGVGEKTAIDLLLKFQDLDNLYKELEEDSEKAKKLKPKLKEILLEYKEQSFLSRELAEINKNSPLDFNLEKGIWGNYDKGKIIKIFEDFEFNTLLKKFFEAGKEEKPVGENLKLW